METKKHSTWVLLSVACLLVIAAYQGGKFAGESSAQSDSREKELAFQKEKEATRKAEFAKVLRIYEEERQAAEKWRRYESDAEVNKQLRKMMDESRDRQAALIMKMLEILKQK